VKGGRAIARGMLEGWQSALRWPKEPQRAQRMGSLQSATLWSLERQRKQRSLSDALLIGKVATWFKEAEAERRAAGGSSPDACTSIERRRASLYGMVDGEFMSG
jgi:hypothetical protein